MPSTLLLAQGADTVAPSTPADLTVTTVSSSEMELTWSASTDDVAVTGYKVYRRSTSTGPDELEATLGTVTEYTHSGITPYTKYWYSVSAIDAAGNESAKTALRSGRTLADTSDTIAPSIPTNLLATTPSSTEISLTWSASTDNVAVTGYKVYRRSTSTGDDILLATPGNVTTYTDSGLGPDTKFWYSVSAIDAAGNESAKTALRSARTPLNDTNASAPTVPGDLTAVTPSSSEIYLTWSASTDDVAVTGYKVYRRSTSTGEDALLATLGTILNYSDTGLVPDTKFWYSVSAIDAAGNESAKTALRSARTPLEGGGYAIPTTPSNFNVAILSSSAFKLTWSASSDDVAVTGYKIYRRSDSTGPDTLLTTVDAINTTYEDTGHSPNTKFWYSISAIDADGNESARTGLRSARTALYDRGEADLPAGVLGPYITVGIFNYTTSDLRDSSLRVSANGSFAVLNRYGEKITDIPADKDIKVKYNGDKEYRVYDADTDATIAMVSREVRFEAASSDTIFDISRPSSSFDRYRGNIKLRYYDSPVADGDRIWVINTIPLEHYTWGMGEITGTGADEYDKVMTTMFRTYGYWKIKWSTKWADLGFKVNATAGDQVYYGYDWEVTHPDIRDAAEATRGELVMWQEEIALTAYSAWTDGNTRRYEDGHWGRSCESPTGTISEVYPYLSSVSDPKGKHATLSTCELAASGNHMVGLSANGALRLASDSGWQAKSILSHYLTGVYFYNGY